MATLADDIRLLHGSDLLDARWYRSQYPDVVRLRMDPAHHYLVIGAWLGRNPSPRFNGNIYLRNNPDVAAARMNPLVHYLRYGKAELRPIALAEDAAVASNWDTETEDPAVLTKLREAFDEAFYLASNRDVAENAVDPLVHYMREGWVIGLDPTPTFSTTYYLEQSPDLKAAGMNPFRHYVLHGHMERRPTEPFQRWLSRIPNAPSVTAVVPNYNHARYLRQRIDSILNQTYPHVQILLLDDCSTDESRDVIAEYCERYPQRVRAILNDENAGNVFRQWRRGVNAATTDLVWICESDDFCDPDFLENLIPHFRDRSVQLAFGRIQFAEEDGSFRGGLDAYREGAEAGIWDDQVVRPSAQWFAGGFGVNNLIANVGGCVWRNKQLPDAVWDEAQTYSILGDWFLYLHISGGGQIAYEPSAVASFRQHGKNTSVSSFRTPPYYEEHHRLMTALRKRWTVPSPTIDQFFDKVAFQYRHFDLEPTLGPIERYIDIEALKSVRREIPHIIIAFLGFHPGGGEAFPIALANALHTQGWLVSMLAFDLTSVNEQMAASLDAAIPVYDARQVAEMGVNTFARQAEISLVHSHMISLDNYFIEKHGLTSSVPYVVSLHGSYEGSGLGRRRIEGLARRVNHWVYTTERNLIPLDGAVEPERLSKIPNGMPPDDRPFSKTRAELGIEDDAFLLAFVARGIKEKGWEIIGDAFTRFRDQADAPVHLILCGTGDEADRAQARWGTDPDMSFMGFQAEINGLYRMSDCALAPTRFHGESFPLCVIQALQEGVPVVATDIGEIKSMVTDDDGNVAGVLVPDLSNDEAFVDALVSAMHAMRDQRTRAAAETVAKERGALYDIDVVAKEYAELYRRLLAS